MIRPRSDWYRKRNHDLSFEVGMLTITHRKRESVCVRVREREKERRAGQRGFLAGGNRCPLGFVWLHAQTPRLFLPQHKAILSWLNAYCSTITEYWSSNFYTDIVLSGTFWTGLCMWPLLNDAAAYLLIRACFSVFFLAYKHAHVNRTLSCQHWRLVKSSEFGFIVFIQVCPIFTSSFFVCSKACELPNVTFCFSLLMMNQIVFH